MQQTNETSPDELMATFRGRGMKSIVGFTVAVHAVVILGTSIPFLWRKVAGEPKALTEDERVQAAVREATESLREIADKHGVQPQDLGSRFSGGGAPAPAPAASGDAAAPTPAPGDDASPGDDGPKSAIEEEIEKVEEGPTVPPVAPADEEEDLFK